jgi:HEAT repeat protein
MTRPKNPPKSAAELMAELQKDPDYVARTHEREQQLRASAANYAREVEPVLKDLEASGFGVKTIGELKLSKKEYRSAIPILLYWLPRMSDPQVKEDIVRTLSVPWATPAAAPVLIEEFRKAKSAELRWAIANGLAVTADDGVFGDLVQLVQDREYGKAREMLAVALGNMQTPDAVAALMGLLDDDQLVGHAVMALGKLRAPAARLRLKELTQHPVDWIKKEARKALANINQSLH